MTFNVYLETRSALERYLARLHNIAGDRPLLLAEVGLDSRRNGEGRQAEILEWQVRTAYEAGCAGTFIFSWTDEWYRGGHDIDDWDFGLTRRDRTAKPALAKIESLFSGTPAIRQSRSPKVSVVVCSYNGERTIRQCLEHLMRLDYSNYEVILVNDGSTDSTGEIAGAYSVRLISTENKGLSSARNTGMKEAAGELIAYIDDDAWPDPHWLTYLVDTFEKVGHAGVGGPNIPPEDDTWIARCVANAPGGPIHVLLSDEVAEHIPGCNMAFRKSCLEEIGGFDTTFRVAGDDVDLCWRLQQRGWTIGFNPAAMVWHRRRGSVRAYWRQQKGYGKAEALLERKWPEKYQAAGNVNWQGRLYGKGLIPLLGVKGRIYHGRWGMALFQSLYQPALDLWRCLPLMPEWYVIVGLLGGLAMLGSLWPPLIMAVTPLFVTAVGISIVQAAKGALRASGVRISHPLWSRGRELALTTWLFLLQPCARLVGRWSTGLTPWRLHVRVPPALPAAGRLMLWNERWRDAESILGTVEKLFQTYGAVVIRGGDFDCWDLEVRAGALGRVRLLLGIEEHGSGKQMLLFRHWPFFSSVVVSVALIAISLGVAAGWSGSLLIATVLPLGGIALLTALIHQCGVARRLLTTALHDLGTTDPYIHRFEPRAQRLDGRSGNESGLPHYGSPVQNIELPLTSRE
jgi:GT2 family glycosyltransferase